MATSTSANALFGFPNRADPTAFASPVFLSTGALCGSWQDTAPLSSLQNRLLAYKARSTDVNPTSSQFVLDLSQPRAIQIVAVPSHNMLAQTSPSYTIGFYNDAGCTSAAAAPVSGSVFPVAFPFGSLPFEHESWLDGKRTPEQAALYPQPIVVILAAPVLCRYIQVQLIDPANAAGYIELSRIIAAPGWQPTVNIKYGAQIGVNDPSVRVTSLGEVDFYDIRTKRRKCSVGIDYLDQNEAFVNALDMQMMQGLSGQIFFSYAPQDSFNLYRLSFLATLTQLDALSAAVFGYQSVAFNLQEVVG